MSAWTRSEGGIVRSDKGRIILAMTADRHWAIEIDGRQIPGQKPISPLTAAKQAAGETLRAFDAARDRAYTLGAKARLRGTPELMCPFEPDTLECLHWREGWTSRPAFEERLALEAISRAIAEAGLETFAELLSCAGVEVSSHEGAGDPEIPALVKAAREALGLS